MENEHLMSKAPNPNTTLSEDKKAGKHADLAFHYWHTINYFIGLIKSSELKAGLILSFYGIILNFIYRNTNTILDQFNNQIPVYLLLGLWLLCTMISIYYSIRTFIPRIESNYEDNVFFFGDIISKYGDIKAFSKTFYNTSVNKEQRYDQMGQQIYINAKIAATKFKNVNLSLRFLAIGLILLLILAISYVIIVVA